MLKRSHRLIFEIAFVCLLLLSTPSYGQVSSEDSLLQWPSQFLDSMSDEITDQWDYQGSQLSASIFESLTDIEIYSQKVGEGKVKFGIERKVYDNHDLSDSWTVIDFFQVPFSMPIDIDLGVDISPVDLGLSLSTKLGMELVNIRQVLPRHMSKLMTIEELDAQVKAAVVKTNETQTKQNISDKKEKLEEFSEDGEKIINPLSLDINYSMKDIFSDSFDEGFLDEFSDDPKDFEEGREQRRKQRQLERQAERKDKKKKRSERWENSRMGRWLSTPKERAKYSNILNLLTHPFRVPITSNAYDRMEDGEIATYSLDGTIQLSGNIGWSIVPVPTGNFAMGVTLMTYLNGRFKISILKESEDYARVKLTRRLTRGDVGQLGAIDTKHTVFKGLVIFGETIAKWNTSVIPFALRVNQASARSFDVGYRYNMKDAEARKAYLHAVQGRFKRSEELLEKGVVEKIFTRRQKTKTSGDSYKMTLSFFYERAHTNEAQHAEALIGLPTGTHHLFKSSTKNIRGFDTLWGHKESVSYIFSSTIDKDLFQSGADEKGIAFRAQVQIQDSHTSGKELFRYINEVEKATGQHHIFPRYPLYYPLFNCEKRVEKGKKCYEGRKRAKYGKSSFYYRLAITRGQLEKIVSYPESGMWRVVEEAFGVKPGSWGSKSKRAWHVIKKSYAALLNLPLKLVDIEIHDGTRLTQARRFIKHWKNLQRANNLGDVVKIISKMFYTTHFSFEYINILKGVLKGEELSYFIDGRSSKTFGQIIQQGNVIGAVDTISEKADRDIEFDSVGTKNRIDESASIEDFKANFVDDDTVELTYKLKSDAQYVFLRVDRTAAWKIHKNLVKFIIPTRGLFKAGKGKITIKRGATSGYKKYLAEAIFSEKFVTIMMAIRSDSKNWGAVNSNRVQVPESIFEDEHFKPAGKSKEKLEGSSPNKKAGKRGKKREKK